MPDDERGPMDEGHQYDRPEPEEETHAKAISYAVLGALVVLLMLLIATGKVQIFNY